MVKTSPFASGILRYKASHFPTAGHRSAVLYTSLLSLQGPMRLKSEIKTSIPLVKMFGYSSTDCKTGQKSSEENSESGPSRT